jgi:hypothetical protein
MLEIMLRISKGTSLKANLEDKKAPILITRQHLLISSINDVSDLELGVKDFVTAVIRP